MADKNPRPFLASQRHDVLRDLVADRNDTIDRRIADQVALGIDPAKVKIDGKGGALDGTTAVVSLGGINAYVPICGAYPGPKVEHPKGKEGKDDKDGKDAKDGKEGKEGKEAKDGKEDKEGKESKDSKESSDGGKFGGDENQNPFSRFGNVQDLPIQAFNDIAQTHSTLLRSAIERGNIIF